MEDWKDQQDPRPYIFHSPSSRKRKQESFRMIKQLLDGIVGWFIQ